MRLKIYEIYLKRLKRRIDTIHYLNFNIDLKGCRVFSFKDGVSIKMGSKGFWISIFVSLVFKFLFLKVFRFEITQGGKTKVFYSLSAARGFKKAIYKSDIIDVNSQAKKQNSL